MNIRKVLTVFEIELLQKTIRGMLQRLSLLGGDVTATKSGDSDRPTTDGIEAERLGLTDEISRTQRLIASSEILPIPGNTLRACVGLQVTAIVEPIGRKRKSKTSETIQFVLGGDCERGSKVEPPIVCFRLEFYQDFIGRKVGDTFETTYRQKPVLITITKIERPDSSKFRWVAPELVITESEPSQPKAQPMKGVKRRRHAEARASA